MKIPKHEMIFSEDTFAAMPDCKCPRDQRLVLHMGERARGFQCNGCYANVKPAWVCPNDDFHMALCYHCGSESVVKEAEELGHIVDEYVARATDPKRTVHVNMGGPSGKRMGKAEVDVSNAEALERAVAPQSRLRESAGAHLRQRRKAG